MFLPRVLRSSVPRRPAPLEQPQRLGLLLLRLSLGGTGLRRSLRTPGLTPGPGSGSLVRRILRFVLPLGPRPFDHRRNLLGQAGQVPVIEGLYVWVGRGLLHPDGGPAALEGHDDLQVLGGFGLVSSGLLLGVIGALAVLCGLTLGVLLFDSRGSRVARRIAEETLVCARGIRAGCFRSRQSWYGRPACRLHLSMPAKDRSVAGTRGGIPWPLASPATAAT